MIHSRHHEQTRAARGSGRRLQPGHQRPAGRDAGRGYSWRLSSACLLAVLLPGAAHAASDCQSIYDEGLSAFPWSIYQDTRYTLCYDRDYRRDVDLASEWIENAFAIAREKYGVHPPVQRRGYTLQITIFLVSQRTAYASASRATVVCCQDSVSLEIHIMSPSAPDYLEGWTGDPDWVAGMAEDRFIKTLTHEMMNTLHYESREPPNISPPRWILEGLAEFEGYYNTTPGNLERVDWLIEYVYEHERDEIIFGRTLERGEWTMMTSSRYYGSAVIMIFLAEKFGERIHPQLFTASLRTVLRRFGVDRPLDTFVELGEWLESEYQARSGAGAAAAF